MTILYSPLCTADIMYVCPISLHIYEYMLYFVNKSICLHLIIHTLELNHKF